MASLFASSQPSQKINQLYVFGDSLSDVGTVFRATGGMFPPNPPYFQGRYSNGLVWVEHLAAHLALKPDQNTNFACGGATTGTNGMNGIPGLLVQVQNFTQTNQNLNVDALYIIWAGANDYLHGANNSTIVVENLSKSIKLLTASGAKKILVANLPNLGELPSTRNTSNSAALSSLTKAHNSGLAKRLNELSQQGSSGTQIIQFDASSLYRNAIAQPAKFGLTNVTGACLNSTDPCKQPDQFLFWDGIHPTTAAHRILAETAFSALKASLPSDTRTGALY